MKPLIIEYSRTAETGVMDRETIRVVIEVGTNETATTCLETAKKFVARNLECGPDPIEAKHRSVLENREDQLVRHVQEAEKYFANKLPVDQSAIL